MSQNELTQPREVWQGEDGEVRLIGRIGYHFLYGNPTEVPYAYVEPGKDRVTLTSTNISIWLEWQRNAVRLVPEVKPTPPPPPDRCSCPIEDWRDLPSGDVCLICKGRLVPERGE